MNKRNVMIGSLVVLLLASFLFLKFDKKITNYPPKNDTIIAFGDSLVNGVGATEGNDFVSLLSKKIGRPVLNLGVSGDTSAQGLERIDDALSRNPGTVILLLGGNDYLRKVPKEETFNNLKKIILKFQSQRTMVVLLGVRGGILTDGFENSFEDLAEQTGSIYVSNVLDGLFANQKYMSDSVHPNDSGYSIIAGRVYDKIKDYLK